MMNDLVLINPPKYIDHAVIVELEINGLIYYSLQVKLNSPLNFKTDIYKTIKAAKSDFKRKFISNKNTKCVWK